MLDDTNVQLLENNLLIRLLAPAERSRGGMFLPETGRDRQQCGIVLATGPGETLENGIVHLMPVPVGALVLFNKFAGITFPSEDPTLVLIRTTEIPAYFAPGEFTLVEHEDVTKWHLAESFCELCQAEVDAPAKVRLEAERLALVQNRKE